MSRVRIAAVAAAVAALATPGFLGVWGSDPDAASVRAEALDGDGALTWSPPELTDPVTIVVPDGGYIDMDAGRDYLVVFPEVPVRHRVVLDGGRNVVVIGGTIDIPWQGDGAGIWERRGLMIRGQTGTVHVEGLLITGDDVSEGINIDAPDAIVQLENVRIENLHARDQVTFRDNHPDVIQPWGGVGELRVDKLTGETDYQGIFLKEDFGPIGPTTLRRVNLVGQPTARYLLWNHDGYDVTTDGVWLQPGANSWEKTLWPNPDAWPGVQRGVPPTGDFVPVGVAGVGYVPGPYADDDTPPPPPPPPPPPGNEAPTVIAIGPAAAEAGVATYVDATVSDDGLPGPYSIAWRQVAGPSPARFEDPTMARARVVFDAGGTYELEVVADDGELTGRSSVVVVVAPASDPNQPPTVTVASASVTAVVGQDVTLDGSVTDDGLPAPAVVRWRQRSGPGAASFVDDGASRTAARFDVAGAYELELTADDGQFSAVATVHVDATEPPTVQRTSTFSGSVNKKWPVRSYQLPLGEGVATATLTVDGRRGKGQSPETTLRLIAPDGREIARASGTDVVTVVASVDRGLYTWEVGGDRTSFTLDVVHLS